MGAFARILARYGIGYLIAKGLPLEGMVDDPDVVFVLEWALTAAAAGAVEGYYFLAKRWGWPT